MSKELTPWFPRGTYPARKGYYISSVLKGTNFYRYWDGKTWYCGGDALEDAVRMYTHYRDPWPKTPPLTWRGLAVKP